MLWQPWIACSCRVQEGVLAEVSNEEVVGRLPRGARARVPGRTRTSRRRREAVGHDDMIGSTRSNLVSGLRTLVLFLAMIFHISRILLLNDPVRHHQS